MGTFRLTPLRNELLPVTLFVVPTPSIHLTQDPPTGRCCHGDNLTLTCTIVVDPSVDSPVSVLVQWIGPRQGLNATPPTLVSKGTYQSNLTFDTLQTSDSGYYSCDATLVPEQTAYVKKAENGSNSLNVKVCECHVSAID